MYKYLVLIYVLGELNMQLFSVSPFYYNDPYSAGTGIGVGVVIAILVVAIGIEILFACLTGAQARKKGYSYGAWWCLSFFLLSWIALVIICCMSSKSAPATSTYNYSSFNNSTWKCQCGHVNEGTRITCLACGRSKNQPKAVNNWICPNCNNNNSQSSLYCSNCGTAKPYPQNNVNTNYSTNANFNNNPNISNNFSSNNNFNNNVNYTSNVQTLSENDDKWLCPTCFKVHNNDVVSCPNCGTAKPD